MTSEWRKRARGRWKEVYYTSSEWSEFFCGTTSLIWAVTLLNPFFDTFKVNPKLYAPFVFLTPSELVWGTGFLLFAGVQIWALFIGRLHVRIAIAFIASMGWTFIAVLFLLGDPRSAGPWLYGTHGFAMARVYLILTRGRSLRDVFSR